MSRALLDYAFDDDASLAATFAQAVAANLRAALGERGRALIGLSGGSTPRRFLQELSRQRLDWNRVVVTLCDDRWVAPDSDRSNEKLLRETLLLNHASAATFQPLHVDTPDPEQGLSQVADALAKLPLPFDVIVLGMGSDGHTASLFPGGDHLAAALDPATSARVLPMRAPDAPEPRVTLTLPVLATARAMYLHIEGADKKAVLDHALAETVAAKFAPIRVVLEASAVTPATFWCP